MSRTDPAIMVRIPADLKDRLRKQADSEHRTLTGQVIHLLARALPENGKADTAATVSAS